MGTASSLLREKESDDIMNDEGGDELGVIKKIPVEYPQRKTLSHSLRSVGSFGKKKNSNSKGKGVMKSASLRSAHSLDESEAEKLRKEYDAFRASKQSELSELSTSKDKLQSENRRLRGESKVLQSTCQKLRYEREMALEAGEQALQRAAAFEKEKDKVQRQFKIYREAKEHEIKDLLAAKRELEAKVQHLIAMHGFEDGQSGGEVGGTRNNLSADWWTSSLESEPSIDGLANISLVYGPNYGQALMERDGPFTNVSRDDWNAVMPSLVQVLSPELQTPVQPPVLRVYVSAPHSMIDEVNMMKKTFLGKLESLCEDHGRFAVLVHIDEDGDSLSQKEFSKALHIRQEQIKQCQIFLAFLGGNSNRFTYEEFHQGHLAEPGKHFSVFCFQNPENRIPEVGNESVHLAEKIKMEIRKSTNLKLFDNYESAEEGAQLAYVELSRYMKKLLSVDSRSDGIIGSGADDQWCETCVFDRIDEQEQIEMLQESSACSFEVGLTKYYSDLNMHVSGAGHIPPLLVMGDHGAGKSLLLAKWILLQQGNLPSRLLLYHFVGSEYSTSASPLLMLKRLTIQLMRHVTSSPNLSCDPVHLEEEFPRWLEKVSSKLHGGITIVIDSADRLDGVTAHMQWLLDPLPASVRVILSVNPDCCPQAWRSWPSVKLEALDEKVRQDLLTSVSDDTMQTQVPQICQTLDESSSPMSFNPRFLCYLVAAANSQSNFEEASQFLMQCAHKESIVDLLHFILVHIQDGLDESYKYFLQQLMDRQKRWREELLGAADILAVRWILLCIAVSRNGMTEPELLHMIPMPWPSWLDLHTILQGCGIITYHVGIVYAAICKLYHLNDSTSSDIVQRIVDYYEAKMSNCSVTYRLIDELPWLLCRMNDKNRLQECLLDMNVFARFFERGRISELVGYWKFIGQEQSQLGKMYLDVIRCMECDDKPSVLIADLYVAVGQFLKYLGLLSQAAPSLQKALEIRETSLDPDHPLVAQSLHHLAELYAYWGNFSAAEAFYKQAIEITENALGPDHVTLAKDLEGLSILYKKNEKYSQGEPYHKRAIAIRQKSGAQVGVQALKRKIIQVEELAVGPGNQELAKSMNELGVLYYLQKNYEAAKSFFQRSLAMREEILNRDHPEVAQSLHNLAALYNDQKLYDMAEPLYQRALDIRMKAFPPHHACIASTVKHLALLYRKQGKNDQAEPLYRQALEARETVLGHNHPSVGTALNNLAVVLCLQNKQGEALPLYERALRIYEDSLGPNHPRVAEALVNLAKVYYDQGFLDDAVRLYKQASDIQHGSGSGEHPSHARAEPWRSQSMGRLSNNSLTRRTNLAPPELDAVSVG